MSGERTRIAAGVASAAGGGAVVGFGVGLTASGSHDLLMEAIRQAGAIGGLAVVFLAFLYAVLSARDRGAAEDRAAAADERKEAGARYAATIAALVAELHAARIETREDAGKLRDLIQAEVAASTEVGTYLKSLWERDEKEKP